jgi:hypothetical protein
MGRYAEGLERRSKIRIFHPFCLVVDTFEVQYQSSWPMSVRFLFPELAIFTLPWVV